MHLRILLADRDEQCLLEFSRGLESEGHAVRCLSDASPVAQEIVRFLPHVAFINVGMPGTLATSVVATVRRQPMIFPMWLVATIEDGEAADEQQLNQAGFDGVIRKPLELDLLRKLLAELPDAQRKDDL